MSPRSVGQRRDVEMVDAQRTVETDPQLRRAIGRALRDPRGGRVAVERLPRRHLGQRQEPRPVGRGGDGGDAAQRGGRLPVHRSGVVRREPVLERAVATGRLLARLQYVGLVVANDPERRVLPDAGVGHEVGPARAEAGRHVTGEHGGATVEQIAIRELADALRSAGHDRGGLDRIGRRPRRSATRLVDLHRGKLRLGGHQAEVGQGIDDLGALDVAEVGDGGEPRFDERGAHQRRPRRSAATPVEIVAHDDESDTGARQGFRKPGRPPARGEHVLHAIEEPDVVRPTERDQVARRPRCEAEPLQRLVERSTPRVLGERRGGHEQRAGVAAVGAEVLGRLLPVRRHRRERATRHHPTAERRPHRDGGDRHGRDCRHRGDDARARGNAADRDPRGRDQVDEADEQHDAQRRVELRHVASEAERSVEQGVQHAPERTTGRAGVARPHHEHADDEAGGQHPPVRHGRPHQADHSGERDRHRGSDHHRVVHEQIASPTPRLDETEVAEPVAGPTQHLDGGHRAQRRGRSLRVREEVEPVARLEHQRQQPPQRRQPDSDRPPGEQPPPDATVLEQDEDRRQDQRGER